MHNKVRLDLFIYLFIFVYNLSQRKCWQIFHKHRISISTLQQAPRNLLSNRQLIGLNNILFISKTECNCPEVIDYFKDSCN